MYFDDFDTEEVFANYAKIMQDEGHLDKKASYVAPRNLLGDNEYTEIDINEDLVRIAKENGGGNLYDIFSEDVMANAHPEGSTKVADAPDGLGEVETLEDAQKKIKEVAEKKVKLAGKVLALATELDLEGFTNLAMGLDEKVAEFLGKKAAEPEIEVTMGEPTITNETPEQRLLRERKEFHAKVKDQIAKGKPVNKPTMPAGMPPGRPGQTVDPGLAKEEEAMVFTEEDLYGKPKNEFDFTQPGALPADWDK